MLAYRVVAALAASFSATVLAQAVQPLGETLEEVIVTAEKREADVQKISASVVAVTSEELRKSGSSTMDTALRNVAGVGINGGSNQLFIRGIGSTQDAVSSDSSVVVNIDGANLYSGGQTPAAFGTLNDVERIEIVRGPQGTMSGRNSIGGSINIITREPELSKLSFNGGVRAGNYNYSSYDGVVNVPLAETLALRVAGKRESHDEYVEYSDGTPVGLNQESSTVRGRLLWKPSDDFRVLLTTNYLKDASNRAGYVPYTVKNGEVDQIGYRGDHWTSERTGIDATFGQAAPSTSKMYQAQVDWTLPVGQLVYVPAYTTVESDCSDPAIVPCQPSYSQRSHELRLASLPDSKFIWVAGLYYQKTDGYTGGGISSVSQATRSDFGGFFGPNLVDPFYQVALTDSGFIASQTVQPAESYSIFAQTTIPFTDTLRGKLGVRALDEKRNQQILLTVWGLPAGETSFIWSPDTGAGTDVCQNCVLQATYPQSVVEFHDKPVTWTAGVEYDVFPQSMLYAQVGTGFRAGGTDLGIIPAHQYEPEDLTAYSVGMKNRFWESRAQVNVEAYYYRYKNYQVFARGLTPPVSLTIGSTTYYDGWVAEQLTFNADTGTSKGIDIETEWLLTPADRVRVNLSLADGEYGDVPLLSGLPDNISGQKLINNASVAGNASYEHTFNVFGGRLSPRADVRYSSGYRVSTGNLIEQPAFWSYDAYLNYTSDNGRWAVNLYGKNLENTAQVLTAESGFVSVVSVTDPRTFGMGVSFYFDGG